MGALFVFYRPPRVHQLGNQRTRHPPAARAPPPRSSRAAPTAAAGRRGAHLALERGAVLEARLAQSCRQVDKAGADDKAGRVDAAVRAPAGGRGADRRDPSCCEIERGDAVDAVARAVHASAPPERVLVGTGTATPVLDVVERLAARVGWSGEPAWAPARPGDPTRSALDPAKADKALGWRPWTPSPEGLAPGSPWQPTRPCGTWR